MLLAELDNQLCLLQPQMWSCMQQTLVSCTSKHHREVLHHYLSGCTISASVTHRYCPCPVRPLHWFCCNLVLAQCQMTQAIGQQQTHLRAIKHTRCAPGRRR